MGGQPQRLETPRTTLEDQLGEVLRRAAAGDVEGLQNIFKDLTIPGYTGQTTAGINPLQTSALNAAGGSLAGLPDIASLGRNVASGLSGVAGGTTFAPDQVLRLLANIPGSNVLSNIAGGGGPGGDILSRLAGGSGAGAGLANLAGTTPDFSALASALGSGGAESPLSQFLNIATPERTALNQLATGGPDFGGILSSLDQARQATLGRSLRDISERFSASGLRNSTDLASALGQTANESQTNFLGQAAQLLPQLMAQKIAALQTGGQLGLGGAQIGTQAATGLTEAGTAARGQNITGGTSLGQLLLGSRGQTGDILSSLGNINLADLARQLQAGTTMQNLGLGAATTLGTQGTGSADILSQLYGGQQQRSLAALLGLPGAEQTFAGIPTSTATSAYNLGEQARGTSDVALQRQMQEFLRTQGALFGPLLNFAAGAPQITGPGKGSQILGAGAALGAGALAHP